MTLTAQQRRALRVLDHAIEHLGPSRPCSLLITDGTLTHLPYSDNPADLARAVLGRAMCQVVNPGDGWSRYTLVEIVNEQGGETARSRCGTAGEMDYILDALFRALVWKEFAPPKQVAA